MCGSVSIINFITQRLGSALRRIRYVQLIKTLSPSMSDRRQPSDVRRALTLGAARRGRKSFTLEWLRRHSTARVGSLKETPTHTWHNPLLAPIPNKLGIISSLNILERHRGGKSTLWSRELSNVLPCRSEHYLWRDPTALCGVFKDTENIEPIARLYMHKNNHKVFQ